MYYLGQREHWEFELLREIRASHRHVGIAMPDLQGISDYWVLIYIIAHSINTIAHAHGDHVDLRIDVLPEDALRWSEVSLKGRHSDTYAKIVSLAAEGQFDAISNLVKPHYTTGQITNIVDLEYHAKALINQHRKASALQKLKEAGFTFRLQDSLLKSVDAGGIYSVLNSQGAWLYRFYPEKVTPGSGGEAA